MKRTFVWSLGVAFLAAGLLVGPQAAQAITYDFTVDHCTGGCGTPPFGDVTLLQNGTNVDVTVHLISPNAFVKTGAGDDMAFKFNATGVPLADVTVDAHTPALQAAAGTFNGGNGGLFGFGIEAPTQGPGSSDPFSSDIVFHVANATIADLTVPNNLQNIFAADIIGATKNTGLVVATGPREGLRPIPEPDTILLLGTGLMGLGGAVRRRTK